MILLDHPYVSPFLKETIRKNKYQVFEPSHTQHFTPGEDPFCLREEEAIQFFRQHPTGKVYTNSENAIHWISRNLGFSDLPGKIETFKDKVAFRKLTEPLYPGLFFREVAFGKIQELDISGFPFPFVIKPAVGFFSLGVYTVKNDSDWKSIRNQIHAEISTIRNLYPSEVLDTSSYIVEQYIYGDEYAFDAYFDEEGKPVILNILKHYFASASDVSDRVYVTSKQILLDNLQRMEEFLEQISGLLRLRNFPLHVEVRIDQHGRMIPIEINPLRFGGWCTTADNTWYAYGFNAYSYFIEGLRPNWDSILDGKDNTLFSLIVLNNSTGIPGKDILSFKSKDLLEHFYKPLEFREADHRKFPLFGFLFTETPQDKRQELDWILHNDLSGFIVSRGSCPDKNS